MKAEGLTGIEKKVYDYFQSRLSELSPGPDHRGRMSFAYLPSMTKMEDDYMLFYSAKVDDSTIDWAEVYPVLKDRGVIREFKDKSSWARWRDKAPKFISCLKEADRIADEVRKKYNVDLDLSPYGIFSHPTTRIDERTVKIHYEVNLELIGLVFHFRTRMPSTNRDEVEVLDHARLCIDALMDAWDRWTQYYRRKYKEEHPDLREKLEEFSRALERERKGRSQEAN